MRKSTFIGLVLAAAAGGAATAALAPAGQEAAEGSEASYVLTPASGTEVENFNSLTLEFPGIKGVQYQENLAYGVVLKNLATEDVYECEPVRESFAATEGTLFTLAFYEFDEEGNGLPIVAPGDYELEIKKGAFYYGEEDEDGQVAEPVQIEGITAVYTIDGEMAAYTLTPADGSKVENFNLITLEFPNIKGVQYQPNLSYGVVLKNLATEEVYECEPVRESFAATEGTLFTLAFYEFDEEGNGLPIVAPGDYQLEIKKGAFYYGEEDEDGQVAEPVLVEGITAVYTIDGPVAAYILNPTDGSKVENFNLITLEFPNIKGVQYQPNLSYGVVLKNLATEEVYECEPVRESFAATEGTLFTLAFYDFDEEGNGLPIVAPGDYQLEIKKGAFYYGEEDEDGQVAEPVLVEGITAVYTIDGPVAAYILNPADGSKVENFNLITLDFPNIKGVQYQPNLSYGVILKNLATEEVYECEPVRESFAATEGTLFTLAFYDFDEEGNGLPIVAPGDYELEIKKGAFYYGEEDEDGLVAEPVLVEGITAVYTIDGAIAAYELDPASGSFVENFDLITLSFPNIKGVQFVSETPYAVILTNLSTGDIYECEPDRDAHAASEGTVFALHFMSEDENGDFASITEAGDYKLEIKQGAFMYGVENEDGIVEAPEYTQAITATYTIKASAVNTISEEGIVNVYNVNGMMMLKGADKSAVNTLGSGLYIINGKKVLVTK